MVWNSYMQEEIERIVTDCEYVQHSHTSDYTREQAKVNAYNEIKEILGIEVQDE